MSKFIHSILSIAISGILLISQHCTSQESAPKHSPPVLKTHSFVTPVLKGKKHNPVLRICIQPSTAGLLTEDLVINLDGTNDLNDINSISIFFTASDSSFSTDKLYGRNSNITTNTRIRGSQILRDSSNYFWVAISLRQNANLDHVIKVELSTAQINGSTLTVEKPNKKITHRIGVALRQASQDNVHTYRIPGLATTNTGALIAVYDTRYDQSGDLQADVDVGMSKSIDGGDTWEPMKIIMDMGEWGSKSQEENGMGDPSILVDRMTNTIWVAGLWIHGHRDERAWFASQPGMSPKETGQIMLVKSEDDGKTWSSPVNITHQIKKSEWYLMLQGPGKGITMEDGTLVFPAQYKDENEIPHSTIIYSKDRGKSWHSGTGAKSKTTEAQVVELVDHSLMLNMRDDRGADSDGKNGTGSRSIAISFDLGKTWKTHPTSRKVLPEPVCNASLIKHLYLDQPLLLFSNPADQYHRKNMTIKISKDWGMTWHPKYYTLIDEGQGRGYSSMTTIDENTVGILYEGSQADLIFQRFSLEDLLHN